MGEDNAVDKRACGIDEMREHIKYLERQLELVREEKELARLHGIIEGLKFAIRCNGVSGGDVR